MFRKMISLFFCFCFLFPASVLAEQKKNKLIKLVAFGDSLTAGYGLAQEHSFPAVLEQTLRQKGYEIEIINAGVSGDTVQGGVERLDWSVPDGTDGVILELGANDMLRGLDPLQTKAGLETIVERLKNRNIPILIAGMQAPPNLGAEYILKFNNIYKDIAQKYQLILYPFFLDGVAGNAALNQKDGLHPTEQGVKIIVERILPSVESFIAKLPSRQ